MNILDIITRKKNNQSLSYDELFFAFNGYLNGSVPDYYSDGKLNSSSNILSLPIETD